MVFIKPYCYAYKTKLKLDIFIKKPFLNTLDKNGLDNITLNRLYCKISLINMYWVQKNMI